MERRIAALEEVLQRQAAGAQPGGQMLRVEQSVQWYGPLPPPAQLAEYSHAGADFPERILRMAEGQALHRQRVEERLVESAVASARRGTWTGFTIGVLGLLLAAGLAFGGHDVAASVIGGADLVSLVTVFVIGRKGAGVQQPKAPRASPPA